ncbi:nucleotidyltransferase domain-containing protein [Fodinibius sp. SL11]|uniref:nucleotidyltransferase domain-containing protein n=1 Tax=Fodinibius sp. SL11 TaxID=3425690 RepID=UPI003F883B55
MSSLQKHFKQFHENIKLKRFEENETLREKRDIIIDKLKDRLDNIFDDKEEELPDWDWFNQGSYEMGTGIKPIEDGDYDIDIGVHFNVSPDEYEDPVEVKEWIFEALDGHTNSVEIKEPCVRVEYSTGNDPQYHVDLAVYSLEENPYSLIIDDEYQLARGKQNSLDEYRFWEDADPKGVIEEFKSQFSGEEDKQYRRIIRYLKRWKDLQFRNDGNAAPVGIGLTVAAYNWYSPKYEDIFSNDLDDFSALESFVGSMLNNFSEVWDEEEEEYVERLVAKLPAEPYNDVFSKMTNIQMEDFKSELEDLKQGLQDASDEPDPHEACKILRRYFGDDFPVPEKKDTAEKKSRGISTSSASA